MSIVFIKKLKNFYKVFFAIHNNNMKRVGYFIIIILIAIFCVNTKSVFASQNYLKIIAGDKEYIYYYPEISLKNGEYYLKDIDNKIDRIVKDSAILPSNASITATSPQDIKITKEKKGKMVDGKYLFTQIQTALKKGIKTINAIYTYTYPEIDSAYINRCLNLKADFTTYYENSTKERKENIKLASSKINGTILFSGEEFSFNKIVGKRTTENGYKNAKVIQEGQFVEGVGGGVCQVSTTLYNTALLAGLKISEYHPHSLAVSYVPKSFDAMVTDLWADLRFINDTNGIVLIFANSTDNSITFSIYGVEQPYTYKTRSEIVEEILPEDKIELVSGLLKGEQVTKVIGKNGYKSKGYLQTYYNGQLLKEELIRNDEYKKIDNLILQGE